MGDCTDAGSPAPDDLSALVRDFGRAVQVAEVAELLVKHVLDLTGARWAEVVEPRGRAGAIVLASTDVELSQRLLEAQRLVGPLPPLPEQRPVTDTLVIGDLWADDRWPGFAAYAAQSLPVRSAVLQYIAVEGRYAAGLAVYDDRPGFFTEDQVRWTRVIASIAGLALAGCSDAHRAAQLDLALPSNRTIGVAVGLLMGGSRLTQEAAFEHLVTLSQRTNRKLRDVAYDLTQNA